MIKLEDHREATIRKLQSTDLTYLIRTFSFPWSTAEATTKQWQQWLNEHQEGTRAVCVLEQQQKILGYGSLLRNPEYSAFKNNDIPEISALWIDEPFRKQGLGSRLIRHLEKVAFDEGYQKIGIGVGLYQDYGPAQKLYFKMGYRPDGNGITYKGKQVVPGTQYPIDDDLILWLVKPLKNKLSLTFKYVDPTTRSLVHQWLKQPHISPWFYGQGLENTRKGIDEFLAGSNFTQYWLGLDHEHPFAFLITSHVDKPYDELTKWCEKDGKTITLDVLIGDLDYLGKGYAIQVIHQFLLSQFPDAEAVLIDPEASNLRAIHVYQKAGFEILGEFIPSYSPHLHCMMKLDLKKLREKRC